MSKSLFLAVILSVLLVGLYLKTVVNGFIIDLMILLPRMKITSLYSKNNNSFFT